MKQLRAYFLRLGELFHRKRRDQELAEELESHLQMHIEDNLRARMDADEARRQALIKFGGMESTVEAYRERRGFSFGGTLLQDLRYATRTLRKSPGFTLAIVLSLALGIGANTAIFSLIDAVMLRFLPVKNPKQLVLLRCASPHMTDYMQVATAVDPTGRVTSELFSYPAFEDLQANHDVLSSTFAFQETGKINVDANGEAGLAEGELASGDYFPGLGIGAAAGRLFTDSDDRPSAFSTAVISYGYWERRFGRDWSVIGKAITINGAPFTIIGVASPEFTGLQPGTTTDVWMPLNSQPLVASGPDQGRAKFLQRDNWWLKVMGRLRPDVSEQRALAQLDGVFKRSIIANSKTPALSELPSLEFIPAGRGFQQLRTKFSQPLFILMAVVALVLLIACANVANLLLARATARRGEFAVRLAVGAGRARLIQQLLTESTLLALIGGTFGLLLAYLAMHALLGFMSTGKVPISLNFSLDLRVLSFTACVSLATGILFGLAPSLRASHLKVTSGLKVRTKESDKEAGLARGGLGKILVVSQVAMSLLLLAGAGLFVRTLANLEDINIGFDPQHLLLFGIDPTQNGYQGERLKDFYQALQGRIKTLSGVRSVAYSDTDLVGDYALMRGPLLTDRYAGDVNRAPDASEMAYESEVGSGFFKTMGIPVLQGRTIEEKYHSGQPKIAVVNEAFARKYFAGSDPIGHRIGFGVADAEIVGVVADTRVMNLRAEISPMVFMPLLQDLNFGAVIFAVRTAGDPKAIIPGVRLAVQALDPKLPISNIRTQVEQIDQTLFQERLFAKLSSFFGLLALILACIGLYGITSYAVARRTNEIGIRMALGARREDILRKVLREALVLVLVGVAIGIPVALGALRLVSSMLFGLKPTDPLTLAGAIAFMLAVAAIAGYLPARRASRVDPMVALRYE